MGPYIYCNVAFFNVDFVKSSHSFSLLFCFLPSKRKHIYLPEEEIVYQIYKINQRQISCGVWLGKLY